LEARETPKAGKYDYPYFDLDLPLEKLQKLYEILREDEIERKVAADTLGMAGYGGGFSYLISAMDKYGLVKTGGNKIIITDLGKAALYGEEKERQQARNLAVLKVELFKELHEQYGRNVTEEQIRAFLRQKAFVDITEAQKMASSINKIYKKVSKYILSAEKPLQPQPPKGEGEGRRETMPTFEPQPLKIQYRNVLIQIPPDDVEAIEFAEKALAFMKREIEEKNQQKATKTK
jgi:hypothetical protein